MAHRQGFNIVVLMQMHFIQCKQLSDKCHLTHFSKNFRFKVFAECVHGPLKTLWRAANCPP